MLVDWRDPGAVVHKIELSAEKVWWDEEGELLALATETKLVLYQFNRKNRNLSELLTLPDQATSGLFVDRIFYYVNLS